jgi:hypothetical protein
VSWNWQFGPTYVIKRRRTDLVKYVETERLDMYVE